MPKPLRQGSLIDVGLAGHGVSQNTRPQDVESALGFHHNLALHILAGRLHCASVRYLVRNDIWSIRMDPIGFTFKHSSSKAPDLSSLASDSVGSHQKSPKEENIDGSGKENQVLSGSRSLFTRRRRPSTGSSRASRTVPELLVESYSGKPLEHFALGIAHFDTESDVAWSGFHEHGPAPILCLPVMNTRKRGKKALGGDNIGYELDGVSGLLVGPIPNFPGFYQRFGMFHLIGDHSKKLGNSAENPETYRSLFMSDGLKQSIMLV